MAYPPKCVALKRVYIDYTDSIYFRESSTPTFFSPVRLFSSAATRQPHRPLVSLVLPFVSVRVAVQLHRELHTGLLTNERLWAEYLNPPPKATPGDATYPATSQTCLPYTCYVSVQSRSTNPRFSRLTILHCCPP